MRYIFLLTVMLILITTVYVDCDAGSRPIPFEPQPSQEDINDRSVFVTNVSSIFLLIVT